MSSKRLFVTDKEVATILGMSPNNLSRIVCGMVRGGLRRKTNAKEVVNIMDAKPVSFGGFRRWKTSELARVLGVTEEDIERSLS